MPPPLPVRSIPSSPVTRKSQTSKEQATTRDIIEPIELRTSLNNSINSMNNKVNIKINKANQQSNNVLETGLDTDAFEEEPMLPVVVTKFGGGISTVFDKNTQCPNKKQSTIGWKLVGESCTDINLATTKQDDFAYNLPKPEFSTKKDDVLSSYKTPYLSEFTRRLSVQASLNSTKFHNKGKY